MLETKERYRTYNVRTLPFRSPTTFVVGLLAIVSELSSKMLGVVSHHLPVYYKIDFSSTGRRSINMGPLL